MARVYSVALFPQRQCYSLVMTLGPNSSFQLNSNPLRCPGCIRSFYFHRGNVTVWYTFLLGTRTDKLLLMGDFSANIVHSNTALPSLFGSHGMVIVMPFVVI